MALCMTRLLIILNYEKRAMLSAFHGRLLIACVAIAGITLVFGMINELRIFIPSLTILAYVAACASKPAPPYRPAAAKNS